MEAKRLLLGDEAVALAAIDSGLSGVYAYPGTPSTEITEFIQKDSSARERGVHSRWCTNEKTAMEAALGMSYAGKRALVCMKHVGMNVCADPFINSAVTGVSGGLIVLAADDPSMHSSQNEQDSRFYGNFAMIPMFEPSNQQEAYDMVGSAFNLSEELHVPVMMRLVTRLAHSRAEVERGTLREENRLDPSNDRGWILLPAIARKQYLKLIDKQPLMLGESESSPFNALTLTGEKGTGIIACGIAYNYVKEAGPEVSGILKLSHYPLPQEKIRALAAASDKILVIEDGQPFVEHEVRAILGTGYPVEGRLTGTLPRTGELTPDSVGRAVGKPNFRHFPDALNMAPRPPQLCPGCGHRDVYTALNEVIADYPEARVFGDIGCYTLGALPPFRTLSSCVDMGASITMAKGAADAGLYPAIAVIGDSTFTHSGMTGLLDAVNENADVTILISDNLTTAMTGGQDSAGTSKYEGICIGLGVDPSHVKVVVPLSAKIAEIRETIRREIAYHGVSVIIARRECIQSLKRHNARKS
ncbi:MAG: indolepyruvate ferredoxin oxidoreductase [Bacteroidales bacterium]|nr:indolepyruvate ferredoxin oxidoreductase [Bacteroidales bacterium]